MTGRRLVRVTDQFFDRLDQLLPAERKADGTPSTHDFLLHDMPTVIEKLATDLERWTTPAPHDARARVLIRAGSVVPFVMVYAELLEDGSVEVFYLDIDWSRS